MTKQICPIDKLLTATPAEINAVCDGATATAAEINLAADPSAYIGTYTVSAPAAIPTTVRVIELNHATEPVVKTIASLVPYAGQIVVIKDISATGTAAHTVTITTGTWNGTHKVATLDALNECLVVTVDSAGNGTVVLNAGAIILS
jgi:hypothetical protein